MINQQITSLLEARSTMLGVGPMSVNCVDAAIELSNEYEAPTLLIASRRQIDSEEFGGGYVNNWSTKQFADYVIERDKKKQIILARDHGGPWQNYQEIDKDFTLEEAMQSAKNSYEADIEAGFGAIHIDPSVDIHETPSVDQVLDRIFELYEFCWEKACKLNRDIIFEIGTEEQSGSTNTQEELDYTLGKVFNYCDKNNLPKPTFVVIQCGTRVMEMRNVGSFDTPVRVTEEIPAEIQLPKMIEICNNYGIFMKEHNTDYLSDEALRWHPKLGIHAANVAPEFGVIETRSLISILNKNGLERLSAKFIDLAFNSNKWDKWMIPGTEASDLDRALIAGHYVFSKQESIEIKKEATQILKKKGIDLDNFLKNEVKKGILRYYKNFRLV